jgi:hypothetical protein
MMERIEVLPDPVQRENSHTTSDSANGFARSASLVLTRLAHQQHLRNE